MGYLVKLDTYGQDPEILKKLLKANLLDYIAMDVKQEVWKFSEVAWIELDESKYLESIEVILNSNIDYEFRTTVIKWVHTKQNIWNIAKYLSRTKKYFLQNFRTWNTLNPEFKWEYLTKRELEELQSEAKKYISSVWIRN